MADVRLAALAASSVLLTSMVIGNAFHQKQQFYPSVVHLTSSSISLAVLYLQGFVFVVLLGKLLRLIFFGQLRAIEIERLNDRGWYAVLETCMAFTLFRNDFSVTFVARFTLLLFTKAFHWLAEDRIDLMARSTMITTMFHLRAIGLLVCLCVCDVVMSTSAYHHLVQYGVTVQLVFGFEYAILLTALFGVLVKYVLYTVDARRDTPFDYKTELLLYNELVVSFIKLSLYLVFIVIMVKLYSIPIFFFRPMYSALRSFKKALFDVRMSRRAINIMNTLYEDATAQHLNSGDNVCIICREEMTPASRAKRLPCAHMFHVRCLRSWFQRQQTCPTCRLDILRSVPTPPPPPAAAQPQPAGNNNNNNNNNNNIGAGNINNNAGGGNRSDAQNSSEQQQQRQQQPAMVPGMPLFAANLLPNIWQPFNLAAVQQQQQQQHVPGQSSGNTTTATASTGSSGVPPLTASPPLPPSFMSVPLFPPPPMGVGGGVPLQWPRPPAALPQLAALSLQQLQQLEASGRAAVEARVQLLADIGTLLDTAAVLMQQYSQVAPPVPTAPPPPHQQQHQQQQQQQPTTASPSDRETADCAEATAAEAGAAQAAAAAESASEVKAADGAVRSEAATAAVRSEAGAAAAKSEAGAAAAKSEADAASTSYTTAEDSSKVQMRQKRLQHFEKLQQQQEP